MMYQTFGNPVWLHGYGREHGVFLIALSRVQNAYLQGLNRGVRLKLPSFWEINGWNTSVRNWTCGAEFG
jgi:hypothetical protein